MGAEPGRARHHHCWLSLYCPAPLPFRPFFRHCPSTSPVPFCAGGGGWAPLHIPEFLPPKVLQPPVLPIDLPASPTCAPATEETKDCFLPNRNSKLRSCAKLAPAPTDEFPAQRGCVAEMGRDEEDYEERPDMSPGPGASAAEAGT